MDTFLVSRFDDFLETTDTLKSYDLDFRVYNKWYTPHWLVINALKNQGEYVSDKFVWFIKETDPVSVKLMIPTLVWSGRLDVDRIAKEASDIWVSMDKFNLPNDFNPTIMKKKINPMLADRFPVIFDNTISKEQIKSFREKNTEAKKYRDKIFRKVWKATASKL